MTNQMVKNLQIQSLVDQQIRRTSKKRKLVHLLWLL